MSDRELRAVPVRSPAEELSGLLRALWRAVARATRRAHQLPSLPEAQVLVLRKLAAVGPLSPARLAEELSLARPTVSNLLRNLTSSGLVERRSSPTDGRSVLLVPTPRAQHVLRTFSRGRVEVIASAIAELPPSDQERLIACLPSLARLLERLEASAGPLPSAPSRPRAVARRDATSQE